MFFYEYDISIGSKFDDLFKVKFLSGFLTRIGFSF